VVICESAKSRYTECQTGFRYGARLAQQLSKAACTEGQSWGNKAPGVIWVNNGCRANFAEVIPPPQPVVVGNGNSDGRISCASTEGRYVECAVPFRGAARLAKQDSKAACTEGQTWGNKPGMVWVNSGCRGTFVDSYSGSGYGQPGYGGGNTSGAYQVQCESPGSSFNSCPWDNRYGRPVLIQQLSQAVCTENSTWGYDGRVVWVDRGCRAKFGAR
jgi:Protein of unknown function (DUF3011)